MQWVHAMGLIRMMIAKDMRMESAGKWRDKKGYTIYTINKHTNYHSKENVFGVFLWPCEK